MKNEEMTIAELRTILTEVWGNRGQRKAAKDIGKGEVSVSRWLGGVAKIGATETLLLRLILLMHRRQLGWRKWLAEYRKEETVETEQPLRLEDML